jgi:hypothetical protein
VREITARAPSHEVLNLTVQEKRKEKKEECVLLARQRRGKKMHA